MEEAPAKTKPRKKNLEGTRSLYQSKPKATLPNLRHFRGKIAALLLATIPAQSIPRIVSVTDFASEYENFSTAGSAQLS